MSAALYNATKQCRYSELLANTPIAVAPDSIFRLDFAWDGPVPQAGQFFLIKPERSSTFLARPISVMGWDRLADDAMPGAMVSGATVLDEVADSAVSGAMVSGTTVQDEVADGAVSGAMVQDEVADSAVSGARVSGTAVQDEIADSAVSGTIVQDEIADSAVSGAMSGTAVPDEVADGAVSGVIVQDEIADGAVSGAIVLDEIADGAVSGVIVQDEIADGAVSGAIVLDEIADGAVSGVIVQDEIADGAVSGVIVLDEIADSAVSGTIVQDEIADSAVSGARVSGTAVQDEIADSAVSGTIALRFLIARRGTGTTELAQLRTGERAWLTGPLGNSWWDNDSAKVEAPIALIGGGIGIAPLVAFARELDKRGRRVYDFYAGFKSASFGLDDLYPRRLYVATEDGSEGQRGRILDLLLPQNYKAVYSCGPMPMLKAVASLCKATAVPCFISMEQRMACGVGACLGCTVKVHGNGDSQNRHCCADGPVFNAEELIFSQ